MKGVRLGVRFSGLLVVVAILAVAGSLQRAQSVTAQPATTVQVYADGFFNPRGLAFTADGALYVAEAGKPGDVTVPLPVNFGGSGPIGVNGRISRVLPGGKREDFVTGLPNIGLYGGLEMLGPTALAVDGGQLYEAAAGHLTVSPLLNRLSATGGLTPVADVGAFNEANPATGDNGDAVPKGNPYGMVVNRGNLYISDGNYNRLIKAAPDGKLSLFAQFDDATTTGVAVAPDGSMYVCQFGEAPYAPGSGRIDVVTLAGEIRAGAIKNLTTPIGAAFAPDGTTYILQFAAKFDPKSLHYQPNGGEVQRLNPDGSTTAVITNLSFPTAMTFGPDGALYIVNYGYQSNDGRGQVLRAILGGAATRVPDLPPPSEVGISPAATAAPAAQSADVANAAAKVTIVEPVDTQKWGYEPAQIAIQAGQSVAFSNSGGTSHTATASQGAFDTGLIPGGQSAVIHIDKPGTYPFFCQPHPWMKGTITVLGDARAASAAPVVEAASGRRPPTISLWRALGFVGIIILGVFAAGFAMRRTSSESPP